MLKCWQKWVWNWPKWSEIDQNEVKLNLRNRHKIEVLDFWPHFSLKTGNCCGNFYRKPEMKLRCPYGIYLAHICLKNAHTWRSFFAHYQTLGRDSFANSKSTYTIVKKILTSASHLHTTFLVQKWLEAWERDLNLLIWFFREISLIGNDSTTHQSRLIAILLKAFCVREKMWNWAFIIKNSGKDLHQLLTNHRINQYQEIVGFGEKIRLCFIEKSRLIISWNYIFKMA